jgi:voltage-gated potassium channel
MTVTTLSTVGFREVQPLSPTGQIFTILLIAGGLGVVLYTVTAVMEKGGRGGISTILRETTNAETN